MDRRGHGGSEAGANYILKQEFEDVVAVVNSVNSRAGPVFVLGRFLLRTEESNPQITQITQIQ
jgi:hypothetical protein